MQESKNTLLKYIFKKNSFLVPKFTGPLFYNKLTHCFLNYLPFPGHWDTW